MVWQGTVNPPTQVTTGSIPVISTNFIKQIRRQAIAVLGKSFLLDFMRLWWNGIHSRLKICRLID